MYVKPVPIPGLTSNFAAGMGKKNRVLVLSWILVLFVCSKSYGQANYTEKRLMVALRTIGHLLLLDANDRLSLVLPITKDSGHYSIRFGSELSLNTEKLISTVDSVMQSNFLATAYIVEVQVCVTKQMVYSYEKREALKSNNTACKGRAYPKGCYVILFTPMSAPLAHKRLTDQSSSGRYFWLVGLLLLLLTFVIGFWLYYKLINRSKIPLDKEGLFTIGQYLFDPISSMLFFGKSSVELSAKESNLLLLLYHSANTTIEREVILQKVWGDEGNYIGRTLDVFISKLRKKLEKDPSIKIVNIRGTGYKLVLNYTPNSNLDS